MVGYCHVYTHLLGSDYHWMTVEMDRINRSRPQQAVQRDSIGLGVGPQAATDPDASITSPRRSRLPSHDEESSVTARTNMMKPPGADRVGGLSSPGRPSRSRPQPPRTTRGRAGGVKKTGGRVVCTHYSGRRVVACEPVTQTDWELQQRSTSVPVPVTEQRRRPGRPVWPGPEILKPDRSGNSSANILLRDGARACSCRDQQHPIDQRGAAEITARQRAHRPVQAWRAEI